MLIKFFEWVSLYHLLKSCKGGSFASEFSQGSGTQGHMSPEGVPKPRKNTGTSPYINNSLFISSFLSHFLEKKYFHGNVGK
jgi:hypothetical protein